MSTFNYTGDIQTFTADVDGIYKQLIAKDTTTSVAFMRFDEDNKVKSVRVDYVEDGTSKSISAYLQSKWTAKTGNLYTMTSTATPAPFSVALSGGWGVYTPYGQLYQGFNNSTSDRAPIGGTGVSGTTSYITFELGGRYRNITLETYIQTEVFWYDGTSKSAGIYSRIDFRRASDGGWDTGTYILNGTYSGRQYWSPTVTSSADVVYDAYRIYLEEGASGASPMVSFHRCQVTSWEQFEGFVGEEVDISSLTYSSRLNSTDVDGKKIINLFKSDKSLLSSIFYDLDKYYVIYKKTSWQAGSGQLYIMSSNTTNTSTTGGKSDQFTVSDGSYQVFDNNTGTNTSLVSGVDSTLQATILLNGRFRNMVIDYQTQDYCSGSRQTTMNLYARRRDTQAWVTLLTQTKTKGSIAAGTWTWSGTYDTSTSYKDVEFDAIRISEQSFSSCSAMQTLYLQKCQVTSWEEYK